MVESVFFEEVSFARVTASSGLYSASRSTFSAAAW